MASVYGFAAACVCAIIAGRTEAETVVNECKERAVDTAIQVAIKAIELSD